MRGRKPTSSEIKRVAGNPGKRRIINGPAFSDGESLAPPDRWPTDGLERAEWARLVPELVRCGVAKSVHQGLLEILCELHAAVVTLYGREHFSSARMAASEYRKTLGEFGLTPANAPRVEGAMALGNTDDDAEEFFGPKPVY